MSHPPCLQYKMYTTIRKLKGNLSKTSEGLEQEMIKKYHEILLGYKIHHREPKKQREKTILIQTLPTNIYLKEEEIILQVDIGHTPKENIEIYATEEKITISAQKPAQPGETGRLIHQEIPEVSLNKSIHLPETINPESITVEINEETGLLTIAAGIEEEEIKQPLKLSI